MFGSLVADGAGDVAYFPSCGSAGFMFMSLSFVRIRRSKCVLVVRVEDEACGMGMPFGRHVVLRGRWRSVLFQRSHLGLGLRQGGHGHGVGVRYECILMIVIPELVRIYSPTLVSYYYSVSTFYSRFGRTAVAIVLKYCST